jgi:gliding motility-associated protein GldM
MRPIAFLFSLSFILIACQDQSKLERAFLLDQSIKDNNELLTSQIYGEIHVIRNRADERPDLKPIAALAEDLPALAKELLDKVDELRAEITNPKGIYLYAGEFRGHSIEHRKRKYEKIGLDNFVETDDKKLEGRPLDAQGTEILRQVFFKEGKGKELAELVKEYEADLQDLLYSFPKEMERLEVKGLEILSHDLEALKQEVAKILPQINEENISWEEAHFANIKLGEAYPILRKIEGDCKHALLAFVQYLNQVSDIVKPKYDKYEVFASTEKPVIVLGETYEADIALGAFASQAEYSITVGGKDLKIENGKAQYKVKANYPATQSYRADITVVNPLTGEAERVSKEFKYEVTSPNLQLSNDRGDVLYVGIDNKIELSIAGRSSNAFEIKLLDGEGITVKKITGNTYVVRPEALQAQSCQLIVRNKNSGEIIQQQKFRIKRLPDPIIQLDVSTEDGTIAAATLAKAKQLLAKNPSILADLHTNIEQFEVYYLPKAGTLVQFSNQGAQFNARLLTILANIKAGDQLIFMNIKGKQPSDPISRSLAGLSFVVG